MAVHHVASVACLWAWSYLYEFVVLLSASSLAAVQERVPRPALLSWQRLVMAVAPLFVICETSLSVLLFAAVGAIVGLCFTRPCVRGFRVIVAGAIALGFLVEVRVPTWYAVSSGAVWPLLLIHVPMEVMLRLTDSNKLRFFRPIAIGLWLSVTLVVVLYDTNPVLVCALGMVAVAATVCGQFVKVPGLETAWLFALVGIPVACNVVWGYLWYKLFPVIFVFGALLFFRVASLSGVICAFVALFVLGLFRLVMRLVMRDRERQRLLHRAAITVVKKRRVAVIGFGTAGILTTKELVGLGHDVVVFEKSSHLGGVWQRQGSARRARDDTLSTSSIENTAFMDFPFSATSAGGLDHIFSAAQWIEYVEAYASEFGLATKASIRYGVRVVSVRKIECGRWSLASCGVLTGDAVEEQFDFVAVCTGIVSEPFVPQVAMECRIPSIHSSEFEACPATWYKDQDVLVVGAGETGSDLVGAIATHTRSCSAVLGCGLYFLPRHVLDIPADWVAEFRGFYDAPSFFFVGHIVPSSLYTAVLAHVFSGAWASAGAVKHGINFDWGFLWCHMLLLFGPPKYEPRVPTKSCAMFNALRQRKCKVNGSCVSRFVEQGAELEDGSFVQCSRVVWATGFTRGSFSFLDFDPGQPTDCYVGVFHPDHPSVAFIGFTRGIIGSFPLVMQMQAKWLAHVVSGIDELPSREQMCSEMVQHTKLFAMRPPALNKVASTSASFMMADFIAAKKLGIDPDLPRILWQSPMAWYTVMFSCISPYHYNQKDFYTLVHKCNPFRAKSTFVYVFANLAVLVARPFLEGLRVLKDAIGIYDLDFVTGFDFPF